MKAIQHNDWSKQLPPLEGYSALSQLEDLILQLLKEEPQNRIGAQNYEMLKTHPFFLNTQWDTLHIQDRSPLIIK